MRFLIQRVNSASVAVEGRTIGKIDKGLLVFVGISQSDTMDSVQSMGASHTLESTSDIEENIPAEKCSTEIADKMVKKLIGLRIFEDENGKTNLDLKSVGGELLIISQFTLYADCRKGNRPSFTNAGAPDKANFLYRHIIERCRQEIGTVEEGSFGAEMKVELVNDGPFTVILDSEEIIR